MAQRAPQFESLESGGGGGAVAAMEAAQRDRQTRLDRELEAIERETGIDPIPGEGDVVQGVESFLERQAAAQREGRGLIPSSEEAEAFARSDLGELAFETASTVAEFGPAASVAAELEPARVGIARRAASKANPAALALGAGRAVEGAGEVTLDAVLAGRPGAGAFGPASPDTGSEAAQQRVQEDVEQFEAATQQLAAESAESFRERPIQTAGSALVEAGTLVAGEAAGAAAVSAGRAGRLGRAGRVAAEAVPTRRPATEIASEGVSRARRAAASVADGGTDRGQLQLAGPRQTGETVEEAVDIDEVQRELQRMERAGGGTAPEPAGRAPRPRIESGARGGVGAPATAVRGPAAPSVETETGAVFDEFDAQALLEADELSEVGETGAGAIAAGARSRQRTAQRQRGVQTPTERARQGLSPRPAEAVDQVPDEVPDTTGALLVQQAPEPRGQRAADVEQVPRAETADVAATSPRQTDAAVAGDVPAETPTGEVPSGTTPTGGGGGGRPRRRRLPEGGRERAPEKDDNPLTFTLFEKENIFPAVAPSGIDALLEASFDD